MPSKIEKDFIDNLQNFTDSLENLVELLKKQHEKGGDAVNKMSASMDGERLKTISEEIKVLSETTGRIDSRTKEILSEVKQARKAKEGGVFQQTSDKGNTKKVVDGVKLILLIAVGVLAIGMAFKIIGKVDPLSVLALSIAIYTIAIAFEKLSNIKGMTTKKAVAVSGLMVIMAMAIMLSSQILRWTAPISLITAFSILAVSATLGVAVFLLFKAVEHLDLSKPKVLKNMLLLPIILPIIASAIVLSSFILSLTQPITLEQGLTALAIGAILGITAYLLLKGLKGQDLSNPKTLKNILLLPLILPMIAASIALSSLLLKLVQPISLQQGLSALAIGGILGLTTFLLLNGLKGQNLSDSKMLKNILLLPLIIPIIMGAIVISSMILQAFSPIKNPTDVLITGSIIALMTAGFGVLAWQISKLGISTTDILKAGLTIVLVSAALVASSYILASFKPLTMNSSTLMGNSLAMGVAILAFLPVVFVISKFNISASSILKAGLAIVLIATAITASSWILSLGKYDKYPSLEWAGGAGLSLLAFGLAAFAISFIAANPLFYAGIAIIPLIAASIVATSYILSAGKYTGGPTVDWAKGVALTLLAFVPAMIIAGVGFIAIGLGVASILLVANSIVDSANILSKGTYTGGPSTEWVAGVASIMSAFAPIMIIAGLGFVPIGFGVLSMKLVANSIVDSANILSSGKYSGGPTKEWAEGVGTALSIFSNVLKNSSGLNISGNDISNFISNVAKGMKLLNDAFVGSNFTVFPNKDWITSLDSLSKVIVYISKNIDEKKIDSLNNFAEAVKNISYSFADLSQSGIDKLSNLSANINFLSVVDTGRLDVVIKSLDTNKGMLQNAVNSISNQGNQQQTGIFDSIKSVFDSFLPKTDSNDQSKVSSSKGIGKSEPLRVDHKAITERMDQMLKKMDQMIEVMGGTPMKTPDLSKAESPVR